jgi:HEAT repeat protein
MRGQEMMNRHLGKRTTRPLRCAMRDAMVTRRDVGVGFGVSVGLVGAITLLFGFSANASQPGDARAGARNGDAISVTPEARIESILAAPFRGDPDNDAVFFLDDHEDAVRAIGKDAVPTLVRALRSDSSDARLKAILCLSVLGPDASPAVNALRPFLESRVDEDAYWTIICLGEIGKEASTAVPDLLSLLAHPQGCPFWEQVGETIAIIASENGKLPEGVGELLSHKSPGARQGALFALGECGTLAEPVIPKIIAALGDKHLLARIHAAVALGKINRRPDLVVPALAKALGDPKPSVFCAAASALGNFGSAASVAVPRLVELLSSRISAVRVETATALGKIGPAARAAIPALTKLSRDENVSVRQAAQKALDSIRSGTPRSR